MGERDELSELHVEMRNFAREVPGRLFFYLVIVFMAVSFGPDETAGLSAFVFFVFVFFPSRSFWEALRRYLRRNDTAE